MYTAMHVPIACNIERSKEFPSTINLDLDLQLAGRKQRIGKTIRTPNHSWRPSNNAGLTPASDYAAQQHEPRRVVAAQQSGLILSPSPPRSLTSSSPPRRLGSIIAILQTLNTLALARSALRCNAMHCTAESHWNPSQHTYANGP